MGSPKDILAELSQEVPPWALCPPVPPPPPPNQAIESNPTVIDLDTEVIDVESDQDEKMGQEPQEDDPEEPEVPVVPAEPVQVEEDEVTASSNDENKQEAEEQTPPVPLTNPAEEATDETENSYSHSPTAYVRVPHCQTELSGLFEKQAACFSKVLSLNAPQPSLSEENRKEVPAHAA
uniref:Uncharacterized protein n=1 Tax=Chromera velia CCMP2878 TaxID=1169474 RepID=A0A0G4HEZ3_9ALVE|eukprot:Cvel_6607.t1-p1 / transcript=Cvel_6607.t1 / gene=Cvel_6607 / organism=Chromera_velia_CCMP2878 / gene_product=hypothetical protein / transcript_product=hypothetical protein / location=Cvel_scaffold327:1788-2745(-) / protein_length=177 / sequence_SO=supercontig / SO=protein_coding / is_pseudo=false